MNRGMTKAERLREMERLYVQHRNGFTDAELAERFGVDRTTVFRDRRELECEIPFNEVAPGRWAIDRTKYLSSIRVNLTEALALYLAARRMSRHTRTHQAHVVSALEKLAAALKQPMTEHLVKTAVSIAGQDPQPERLAVLEALVQGWAEHIKVRITHQALRARRSMTYVISPYLIEPSLWSDGTYVVGYSDVHNGLATFKIERIERAVLTTERFTPPDNFDEQELLRFAWGIWYSDKEPVTVRLKFTGHEPVTRLKESIWHPTQKPLVDTDDGGCIWEAQVAEPQEMLPWIRGWGASVTVLEPESLRDRLAKEVQHLATLYHVPGLTGIQSHRLLWGKADRKTNNIHRLAYHMIDVGQVALALWQRGLHKDIRQQLANWLGLSVNETGKFIAFLAALHDLGKASPAFQDHSYMREPLKSRIITELKAADFQFANRSPGEKPTRHETITTWSLRSSLGEGLLHKACGFGTESVNWMAQALGGHHGVWPRPDQFDATGLTLADKGGSEWATARTELVRAMTQVFEPPNVLLDFGEDSTHNNVMLTFLSAIISVSDWIGSNDAYFPLEEEHIPLQSYKRHAKLHAEHALDRVNWKSPAEMSEFTFEKVFPFSPTDAQTEGIAALSDVPVPAFAIVEAPMGTGKTELAFALYAHWARQTQSPGLYIAMPTTATSNQMHDRTAQFLTKQLGQEIEPLLVHSQALLRKVSDQGDPVEDSAGDAAAAQSWFLPRKKSLLAPYGVGTVDQALMSILQTKHFFVRLLGLSHKVVIFDEVHAYDAYMSELFEQLLSWLRAINTSVIILSATLPDKTRQKLIRAYAGATSAPPARTYPRITFVTSDGQVDAIELTPPPSKTLSFDWLPRDVDLVVAKLCKVLREGGCAAVICNTVGRAQEVFEAIRNLPEEEKLCDDDNLILFHARFPMAWREEIEDKVLRKFGPGPEKGKLNANRPPHRAIVVATQVIEQSLDLDFDVMVSDHAPIDLLLQRAGRLHRHSVNDPRHHPYCLWIAEPAVENGMPQFDGKDTFIYDEYVLLRSWLTLKKRESKTIEMSDDDMTDLIECVYGDRELAVGAEIKSVLDQAKQEMDRDDSDERAKARNRRVVKPRDEELLWGDNLGLEEDDPSVHETFQALTRSGRPGLRVVCLHRIDGRLHLEPEEDSPIYDPNEKPDSWLVKELARRSVTIRREDIEKHLLNKSPDDEIKTILKRWKRISVLRYHRVAIFEDGLCPLEGTEFILKLNKKSQLGLQITKEAI